MGSSLSNEQLNIQLNNYDFYMSKPTPLDRAHGISLPMNQYIRVPVIRIYGSLPSGHQVLCHIHGVLPYIFVQYNGEVSDSNAIMNQKCAQLQELLEKQISASMKNRKNNQQSASNASSLEYIANVSVTKAVPFYAFHVGWTLFYKISILNPSFVNRIADLLRDGNLNLAHNEVYEAHIPYLLQFSADFNLFGCDWIKLEKCYFRKPVLNNILGIDNLMQDEDLKKVLNQFNEQDQNVLESKAFPRMGNGLLEIDVLPQFIQNIHFMKFRDIHHDFIEKIQDLSSILKGPYVTSTRQMTKELQEQRQLLSLQEYKPLKDIERVDVDTEWQSSEDFRKFYEEAKKRQISLDGKFPKFETFVQNNSKIDRVRRPHEMLSQLWPVPLSLGGHQSGTGSKNKNSDVINTAFEEYSLLNITDDEADQLHEEFSSPLKQIEPISAGLGKSQPQPSMDLHLTQMMAKRKKTRFNISHTHYSKVSDNKLSIPVGSDSYLYKKPPVDSVLLLEDLQDKGFPIVNYSDPYFSNPVDLNEKPYIYSGKIFEIPSRHLSNRISLNFSDESVVFEEKVRTSLFSEWKYVKRPPTYNTIENSFKNNVPVKNYKSQIERSSPKYPFLYKFPSDSSTKKKKGKIHDTLTHFTLEIHVNCRNGKRPDPKEDEVNMIVWCIEEETFPFDLSIAKEGIMALNKEGSSPYEEKFERAASPVSVAFFETEFDMFDALTDLILLFDPDILSGFEVHMSSWGYIIERCRIIHKFDIAVEIARVNERWKNKSKDVWGYTHSSGTQITGRHVINIWRVLRSELNLTQYTIENIVYNVLHERLPHFSFDTLTKLWTDTGNLCGLKTVIFYWLTRARMNVRLLQKQEFIGKTMEQARLIGIDFHSVFYRGSQFKVESFLIRICKSESYVLISASKKQVRRQKALECVPLVMEPESAFYKSPLIVLDFQSLYPSIMIAYNYCYSTMIGRVRNLTTHGNELGVATFSLEKNLLRLLENDVTIAPNGVVYAKSTVRKSTLAKMLTEILDIRVMVKKTISELGKGNERLRRVLNNKQLALKLLANVTYGYTSASFSGRMPCSDLADSVVQTGRETLEKAISIIESNEDWGAKVVYGDTDSLFVYLPGKTKEEAFKFGNEMAVAVTKRNPKPVFLKFEKVYHPCILVSKKRYVGYSYENVGQTVPYFDAKGIETVRRDGHPAQQKITEKALKILFDSKDISQVKRYVQSQFTKVQEGRVSVQDFCFAKEVKLGTYKSDKTAPAGAVVATKLMENDHRAEPQYKERVPYLVVKGKSGQILRERSISPLEFFANPDLELDSEYYITKTLVPPLSRLFNVIGIDVSEWAYELKKYKKAHSTVNNKKIEKIGNLLLCSHCKEPYNKIDDNVLCDNCLSHPLETTSDLLYQDLQRQFELEKLKLICQTCSYRYNKDAGLIGAEISTHCNSYDCPIFYSKFKSLKYLQSSEGKERVRTLERLDEW